MNDENQPAHEIADAGPATELQILNGGIEIDAVKIDGSQEKVKVRQLPPRLLGEWGNCQGDEAYLVELLCDKLDRSRDYHLVNARMTEMRVQMILQQADFKQIEAIETRLKAIRNEITALEAKPRWSDTLTYESVVEIREIGMRLNKKKLVEQTNRTTTAAQELLEMMPQKSASPSSSSPSPTSAELPSWM
jgi:hypothetical protein